MSSIEPIKLTAEKVSLNWDNTRQQKDSSDIKVFHREVVSPDAETGNRYAFVNPDGTSYVVAGDTITKYNASGKEILEQRKLTPEEKALSAQDLIQRLQNINTSANQTEKVPEAPELPQDPNLHRAAGNGINGTYKITEKEDGGYKLEKNFAVSAFRNPAVIAFSKGLRNQFGISDIEPDKNGYYNYRGIKAKTYNALSMVVQQTSQEIASETAIYNDLCKRQTDGENLNTGEQKFMQDFKESLTKYGLQINDNGELEDIPQAKGKKNKKKIVI